MKKFSFNNMSVKAKIVTFCALILVFMIIIAGTGLYASTSINKSRSARYSNYAMGEYYLSEAFTNFCNIKVRVRNAIFYYYDDPENMLDQKTKIDNYTTALYDNFGLFEQRMDAYGDDIDAQFELVKESTERWLAESDKTIALAESGDPDGAAVDLMETGRAIADEAEAELAELIQLMEAESEENNKDVETQLNVLMAIMIGVSIIAILVTFTIALAIIRAITIPVNKLVVAAAKLAEGDVNVDCQKLHDDDLGKLMDEFADMVENIRQQADIANTVASGDMTIHVTPRGDQDILGISLQKLVADNNEILGNVKESTQQVTVGAEQVATASQALAQGATEQASALQQVTASMNEIAERTKANASEANQAEELINQAKDLAATGNQQMGALTGALNDINESSEKISKIIKTIDDIAFQTNILALNAAVEAARAGVHGKGFAVVAEEVRNLAAKSASAASETAEMIEDSIHKVENGTRLGEETAKALAQIIGSIDRSVELVTSIATASNDQATAVAQVDQAIGQVSQVVQTNSATSEQCAAASEELSNQAANLRNQMANFKLVGGRGTSSFDMDGGASFTAPNQNEQIISLGGDFGKY